MIAFVTGGTGFTGSHLVKRLSGLNYSIKALARKGSRTELLSLPGVEIIYGDITDRNLIFNSVKGCDIVFNIAAAYRQANIADKQYWDINFEGTKNILDACLEHNIKKMVHCSTIGVVTTVKNPPGDETSEVCPGDPYQSSKCAAEFEVIKYAKEKGLNASVIRPCAIYGPGDLRLLKLFKMIAKKRFVFFGNGKAYLHMVYVENLIDGFLLASQKDEANGEVFIIGDETYISLNELSEIIAEEFNVRAPKIHLPYKPFEILSQAVEFIYKKLKIKKDPPIYKRRIAFFKKSRAFSIDKAKNILGYSPEIDMKTGIHLTAEWYIHNGYI